MDAKTRHTLLGFLTILVYPLVNVVIRFPRFEFKKRAIRFQNSFEKKVFDKWVKYNLFKHDG